MSIVTWWGSMSPPGGRSVGIATLVVAFGLVASACSRSVAESDSARLDVVNFRAVVEREWPPNVDMQRIWYVEEQLVGDCMVARGFEYYPETEFEDLTVGLKALEHRRNFPLWGWNDPALAKRIGYGIEVNREATRRLIDEADGYQSEQTVLVASLSSAEARLYEEALSGSGPLEVFAEIEGSELVSRSDGCLAQAQIQVYGSLAGFAHLVWVRSGLAAMAEQVMAQDDGYQQALDGWRSCALDRGYEVREPWDLSDLAFANAESDDDPERRFDAEVEVAVVEAECNLQVGLRQAGDTAYESALAELLGGPLAPKIEIALATLDEALASTERLCPDLGCGR